MTKFNICMPFYENQGMLRLHLSVWSAYPKDIRDKFRFVIVDDASPTNPAELVVRETPFDGELHLFRVEENIPWGWPAAKNIAMHEIPDGPALLTDIDHLLEMPDAERLLNMKVRTDTHYIPARRMVDHSFKKRHPATYILRKSLCWQIGGFDEAWLGIYGSDFMMRMRADRLSKRVEIDDVTLTLWGRSDLADASTTEFGRKGSEYHKGSDPTVSAAMRKAVAGPPLKVMSQAYHRVI